MSGTTSLIRLRLWNWRLSTPGILCCGTMMNIEYYSTHMDSHGLLKIVTYMGYLWYRNGPLRYRDMASQGPLCLPLGVARVGLAQGLRFSPTSQMVMRFVECSIHGEVAIVPHASFLVPATGKLVHRLVGSNMLVVIIRQVVILPMKGINDNPPLRFLNFLRMFGRGSLKVTQTRILSWTVSPMVSSYFLSMPPSHQLRWTITLLLSALTLKTRWKQPFWRSLRPATIALYKASRL